MSKRDPNKTARNKTIAKIKEDLRLLLPRVLKEVDRGDELSLNAFIGSKIGDFIDLKNEVMRSPDEFISRWIEGLEKGLKEGRQGRWINMHDHLTDPKKKEF